MKISEELRIIAKDTDILKSKDEAQLQIEQGNYMSVLFLYIRMTVPSPFLTTYAFICTGVVQPSDSYLNVLLLL